MHRNDAADLNDAEAAEALTAFVELIGFADDKRQPPVVTQHEGQVALSLVATAGRPWLDAFPTKTVAAACDEFLARACSFIARCPKGREPSPTDPEAYVPSMITRAKFPACDHWHSLEPIVDLCRFVDEEAAAVGSDRMAALELRMQLLEEKAATTARETEARIQAIRSACRDNHSSFFSPIELEPVPYFYEGGSIDPLEHMQAVKGRASTYNTAARTRIVVFCASLKPNEQRWLHQVIDDHKWIPTEFTDENFAALEPLFYKRFGYYRYR
ncbi:hypothetical protein SDRG_12572 [Saprolegnia diclina VS20]|uniref:Uncharacterized protein n=1 Tax=Saprolegnia diclina (strain VS20) TaxID=1156394 RepID=T0RBL0_SAPDV|nr:hypothetical protein SDRG_12572 [Saprolegnia diclina VS20]EQC29563.1 hypothetical protein SDRG_12572 [Saprolegnia diclina VS20]|eukprot:XP_008616867.1 hypothetical protein SDRG_12572 [Saprolegnia diclina VS20]